MTNYPAYSNTELLAEWDRVDEIVGQIVANVRGVVGKPLADHRVFLSEELTRRNLTAPGHN